MSCIFFECSSFSGALKTDVAPLDFILLKCTLKQFFTFCFLDLVLRKICNLSQAKVYLFIDQYFMPK